jgi:protein O-mannosyl-transferase
MPVRSRTKLLAKRDPCPVKRTGPHSRSTSGRNRETGLEREQTPPALRISSSPGTRFLHRPIAGILLVVGLGLLAYSNTFHVPFVFDDEPAIVNNPLIRNLGNFLTSLSGYAYNPRRYVAYLTFAINHHFGGFEVAGYHAVNIAVHLANSLLLFAFVLLSFRTPFLKKSGVSASSVPIAFLSALFFAVHPVQTEAVTYIVQRITSLATFFSLASLCLYVRWRLDPESEKRLWSRSLPLYVSSLAVLVLAMKTKEITFTVPVLIVLYDRFFFETRKTMLLVPFLLTLLIIPEGILHTGKPVAEILSDVNSVTRVKSDLPRGVYLLTQITVIATYLRLLILPVHQNLDYDYPVARSFFSGPVLTSAMILLALLSLGTVLYLRSRPERTSPVREARLVSFGIAWFFITLLVESSVIPITDVIFEHRIYLPSAGFFVALCTGVVAAGSWLEPRIPGIGKAFTAVMVLAAVVLTGTTFLRNRTWRDGIRLWTDVVSKSPRKGRAHYNLGLAYDRNEDPADAMKYYITSISLDPNNGKAHDNLGNLYARQGHFQEAIREFRTALALNPEDSAAHNNLGNVFAQTGRMEDAFRAFHNALTIDPDNAEAYFNIGKAYGKAGDDEKAAAAYAKVLQLDPGNGAARNNLGLLFGRRGRLEDAAAEFRAAIAIDATDADAWNNLGIVEAKRGRFEEAIRHFREALRINPSNESVRRNMEEAQRMAQGNP